MQFFDRWKKYFQTARQELGRQVYRNRTIKKERARPTHGFGQDTNGLAVAPLMLTQIQKGCPWPVDGFAVTASSGN
jgi:hypothetical protein